jgi:hypothetical protein
MSNVIDFLDENPSETVMMSIQLDSDGFGNTRTFEDTLGVYL